MDKDLRQPAAPAKSRLLSLDAFRGIDIGLMILVNMTWDTSVFPRQFFHVGWNEGRHGATLTDLVFPWFLFIAGVAIPFSMHSGRGQQRGRAGRILAGLRRGLVIYLLGCLLNASRNGQVRLLTLDILQFIGLAYFIAVLVCELPRWARIAFIATILTAKLWLMQYCPHPDFGRVVWEQKDNMRSWMSSIHWGQGTFDATIGTFLRWLFNGLFNILPGATVVVMGALAGDLLRAADSRRPAAAARLLIAGAIAWLAALALSLIHPFSKDFFTASYALLAAGSGAVILAALYWIIDVKGLTTMRWARVWGTNAIAFYMLHELLFRIVLSKWTQPWYTHPDGSPRTIIDALMSLPQSLLGHAAGLWTFTILYMLAWWLLFDQLFRRGKFFKV